MHLRKFFLTTLILSSANAHALNDYNVLHQFGENDGTGFENEHNIILDDNSNTLYGVNKWGGYWGNGFFYKIDLSLPNPTYKVLYHFSNDEGVKFPDSRLTFSKDKKMIYGIADNVIYRISLIDSDKATLTMLHQFKESDGADGFKPIDKVVLSHDEKYLYGITNGESYIEANAGTLFRIDLTTDEFSFTTLYRFTGKYDGSHPNLLVPSRDGKYLYGTTTYDGPNQCGTIFQYTLVKVPGNPMSVLNAFHGCGIPRFSHYVPNNLILSHNGNVLYGSTDGSSDADSGYLFKIDLQDSANFKRIYSFTTASEKFLGPASSLAISKDDKTLYGTSSWSSDTTINCGTVFRMNLQKETPSLFGMHSFKCWDDGTAPQSLTLSKDNKRLLGTTIWGGEANNGFIFSLKND